MAKHGKRYQKQAAQAARKPLNIQEAIEAVKSFDTADFDQSVECVLNLGIDPKHADQIVRGSISLPNGIGKQKKVVVFCEAEEEESAKQAGAFQAGSDGLLKKIEDGWMDFDVAIASPKVMRKVGKLGRVLGPKGKMPSPKNGTVTENITQAVKEFKAGKVEFRNDAGGNIHAVVGKQSFETDKLLENVNAFISHIKKLRPQSSKGAYIKKMYLSATMSPSVSVNV